jgi:hypothetical protein
MLYYNFVAGEKSYKLRLNTKNIVDLEKAIGCNPLLIFGEGDTVPTISVMTAILYHSLQQFNHGINLNEAYNIFDEYLADGNQVTDFIAVILEIYKASGLIKEENNEKN